MWMASFLSILIPRQVPFLRHWTLVEARWDFSTVKDLFADPWRFVARIRCDHLILRIMCAQTFKYRIECKAVVCISRRYLRLQYIPAAVTNVCASYAKHFLCSPLWNNPLSGSALDSTTTFFFSAALGRSSPSSSFLSFFSAFFLCVVSGFAFLIQLSMIPFRRLWNGLLHSLLQIRARLDVRSIHELRLCRQVSRTGGFLQDSPEHAFDRFVCESMPECVADRCKARQFL